MRKNIVLLGLLMLTGCSGMNNTQSGALTGGGLGAIIGAIAGGPKHALAGAAIGAAGGGLLGAGLGNAEDNREKRRTDAAIAAANAQAARQMSLDEIVQLSQRGTPDSI